jgi:signal transduction histidine kinase
MSAGSRPRDVEEPPPELAELGRAARHDLSELLGASALHAELLAGASQDALGDKGRRHLDALRLSLRHLQTLLDGLAEYAWAAADPMQLGPLDLEAIAEEVADGLRPQIERRGGALQIGDLPTVSADAPRMRTVFSHLVHNATAHSGREDVHIAIAAVRDTDGWRVSVADDGDGVPVRDRTELLRPFTRRARGGNERTAGIGLSICAAAVKRHGGVLWIDDADPGAVVSFTLPDR